MNSPWHCWVNVNSKQFEWGDPMNSVCCCRRRRCNCCCCLLCIIWSWTFLANRNSRSRPLYTVARPSVVCLSVASAVQSHRPRMMSSTKPEEHNILQRRKRRTERRPYRRSCVRLFVIAGRGPAPQRWYLYIGPMRQPRERRGIGRCVRCMRVVVVVVEMNII